MINVEMIHGEPIAHFSVSKFASIARDLLIGAITLGAYLIVGLILFLTATINLGSFLFFFVGISVITAVIFVITLLRQGNTEYFIYQYAIKICSRGREYILSYSKIEGIKLIHFNKNKSKGTIEFIPYEEYRRRGVRFCFQNLANADKLYETLYKLYLSSNSTSLTISELLDFKLSEYFDEDTLIICFKVYATGYKSRFNYELYGDYITTENYESLAEYYGGPVPEIDEITEYDELPYVDECWFQFWVDHQFNAQNDDEAYNFIKEELLKYIENGRYSDRMKKCKAIFLTDENKFDRIY